MTYEDIPDRLTTADMDLFAHDEAKHARLRQQRREQGIPEPTIAELCAGFSHGCLDCGDVVAEGHRCERCARRWVA